MGIGNPRRVLRTAALLALAFGTVLPAFGRNGQKSDAGEGGRNFDLRATLEAGAPSLAPAQAEAVARLRASVPGLLATADPQTGATRTLSNATGYLTSPRSGDAEQVAIDFAWENLDVLGLTGADLDDYEVTDRVFSSQSGVTHLYLRQRHAGLPVYNGQFHVNVAADGRILSVNNQFVPSLAAALNTSVPTITPSAAVASLAAHLGGANLAGKPVSEPRLMILPTRPGEARLVWNFNADLGNAWYDVTVDAVDGRVWTRFDWVSDAQYRVYETPVEHPGFATPAPPADGRTLAIDPQNASSPFGWHDTNGAAGAEFTTTQGNNAHAYTDVDANNVPDAGSSPDCGAPLNCDFPLDLNQAPSANRPPAVANLFYWNNIIHDIEYLYGFDEVAGNFQENNYGNGGLGSDYVQAEAQDGSGTCNANFGTPADGGNPRMQMFLSASSCWSGSPARDGDLDNLVIVHEYGHGISNRLVGGPSNVSCLGNTEQMGEGTSDWWGLSLTALASQTGPTVRGVGTWLFGNLFPQGIRPFPYSTDNGVNPHTYNSIAGAVSVPHGVGAVWAQGYWEAYWALVDEHGFDPDVYNFTGSAADAGNLRAKYYLIEGLKNTVCSPGFVDVRNGILAAAAAPPYNGVDTCTLWGAFADFGLGFSASQGSSSSRTDQTEAFDLPPNCAFGDAGPDADICAGSNLVQDILVGPAFTAPVALSATGNPAPTSATFNPNPANGPLPQTVQLTIGNTATVAAGTYPIQVSGDDAPNPPQSLGSFDLTVHVAAPGAPTLVSPSNGASGVSTSPTLTWSAVTGATSYLVEVDDNADFSSPEFSDTVTGTTVDATGLGPDTLYHWRVTAENPCGDAASTAFTFSTGVLFCSGGAISIPSSGTATPYPSTVSVVAPGAEIASLTISVEGYSHTFPDDVDVLLVGPEGDTLVLMSDVGGSADVAAVDLLFDDAAAAGLPDAGPIVAGTFRPTNVGAGDAFAAPAPAGPHGNPAPAGTATLTSVFGGTSADGTWNLFVVDDLGGDLGTVASWCVIPVFAEPDIAVDPAAIAETVAPDSSVDVPLDIDNLGTGTLDWTIEEEPAPGFVAPRVAPLRPFDPDQPAADTAGGAGDAVAQVRAEKSAGPLWEAPQGGALWDNGPLVTHPGGGSGGADLSALQTALGLNTLGFGAQATTTNRVADDFTVDAGGWDVDTVTFFTYQTGSTTTCTIDTVRVQIWDGPPNAGGTVIFGDLTTNRFVSCAFTNIYRATDTAPTNTQRPIMAATAAVDVTLDAGTYWIDVQLGGTLASGPWVPPTTLLGATDGCASGNCNALQFTTAWNPLLDTGTAATVQDMPFVIDGLPAICSSPSDVPWLSLSATSGSTPAGGTSTVDVTLDTTGLAAGIYEANLCIESNDPDTPLVVVPVTLTADSMPFIDGFETGNTSRWSATQN